MNFLKNLIGKDSEKEKEAERIRQHEITSKKISSILKQDQELVLMTSNCRIYTYSPSMLPQDWLFSGLEGNLCLIVDYSMKKVLLKLFELETFEVLFEIKFFEDFEKNYSCLTDDFHCIELNKGFLGLKFHNISQACELLKLVKTYTREFQEKLYDEYSKKEKKGSNYSNKDYITNIRSKFKLEKKPVLEELKKHVNTSTNTIEIFKPMYFYLLS